MLLYKVKFVFCFLQVWTGTPEKVLTFCASVVFCQVWGLRLRKVQVYPCYFLWSFWWRHENMQVYRLYNLWSFLQRRQKRYSCTFNTSLLRFEDHARKRYDCTSIIMCEVLRTTPEKYIAQPLICFDYSLIVLTETTKKGITTVPQPWFVKLWWRFQKKGTVQYRTSWALDP